MVDFSRHSRLTFGTSYRQQDPPHPQVSRYDRSALNRPTNTPDVDIQHIHTLCHPQRNGFESIICLCRSRLTLRFPGLAPELPEDLYNLIKKVSHTAPLSRASLSWSPAAD